ncbi:MAG: phosphate ABC transporter permease PstA [Deltaproteobacteria bacterium]|nr:phosphate ABC transporter permease PstA [Deltaproteobacteria bacterium]
MTPMTKIQVSNFHYRRRKIINRFNAFACALCCVFAIGVLLLLMGYVFYRGISAINLDFFIHMPSPVGEAGGGVANALAGTLILVSSASLLGVPVGVFTGLYLAEYGNSFYAQVIRFSTDILNGLPSIVMGLFAYALIVIPFQHFSGYAGALALALLMIPVIVRTTEEVVKLVPHTLREAAMALGIRRWKIILRIVLSTAKPGIVTAIILAVARITGETAPLLFTSFGNQFWQTHLNEPMASLTLQIFTYAISPYEDWQAKAWAGALVLMGFSLIVNLLARYTTRNRLQGR